MRLVLHPDNPQARLIRQVAEIFRKDGIVVYPTDSGYSLGCNALSKKAVQRLYHLKRGIKKYLMALMLMDFGKIPEFAKVDNQAFRYMKSLVPGPYTFILPATHAGRKILDVNRTEIGIRMPDHAFFKALCDHLDGPVLNTAAKITEEDLFIDPLDIEARYGKVVDLIVDMGPIPIRPTTVIDLTGAGPELVRQGAGPLPGEKPETRALWT